jgi:amidohydrolase
MIVMEHPPSLDRSLRVMEALLPSAIALRRALHAHPEVGGTEDRTIENLLDHLAPANATRAAGGFFYRTGSGPPVGVRAELDALGVQEEGDYGSPSRNPGIAHLCGHDVHMAALALVTRVLRTVDLGCGLVSVFQAREEALPSGAVDLLADARLRAVGLQTMLGLHLQPLLPDGAFSAAPGAVNAAADDFVIRIVGRPAHGAYPHQSRDPIVAAAQLVTALQTLTSRESDPMQPGVVSVGRLHSGGDAVNVIPATAELGGTIRSFSETARTQLHDGMRRIAGGIGAACDVTIEVDIGRGCPVLHNDPAAAETVSSALRQAGLTESPPLRSCGADDFAHYGDVAPSVMVFLGVGPGGRSAPGLHHPAFTPDDRAVRTVAEAMLICLNALAGRNGDVDHAQS